jgi:hypothetical protein
MDCDEEMPSPPPKVMNGNGAGDAGGVDTGEEVICRLADLSLLAYHQRRANEAKALGITVAALDKEVARRRADNEAKTGAPPLYPHWEVERWGEEVDGATLLMALAERIRRHVIMSSEQATAGAL